MLNVDLPGVSVAQSVSPSYGIIAMLTALFLAARALYRVRALEKRLKELDAWRPQ